MMNKEQCNTTLFGNQSFMPVIREELLLDYF